VLGERQYFDSTIVWGVTIEEKYSLEEGSKTCYLAERNTYETLRDIEQEDRPALVETDIIHIQLTQDVREGNGKDRSQRGCTVYIYIGTGRART
jgi:hypothetical protein